jgi:SAM-dependent methyltransferase
LTTRQITIWRDGTASEIAFWDQWFAQHGFHWPEDFQFRLRKDTELEGWLVADLDLPDPSRARILDVGAGGMTQLGKLHGGKPVSITPVDPLAPYYAAMAERYEIDRPIPTIQGFAEDLSAQFDADSFDIVWCRNALDHSFDPIRGIEEMLIVVRRAGKIVLDHYVNEAEFGNYDGLHQWNFDVSDAGDFVIWTPEAKHNVTELMRGFAYIKSNKAGRSMRVVLRKRADPPFDLMERYKARLREVLAASVAGFELPPMKG